MSIKATSNERAAAEPSAATVDMKFEVVVIPVSDADRSKRFYGSLGWRLDADFAFDNGFRVIQFTPPGSTCSVQFGTRITSAEPGTAQGLYLVVSDIHAAREDLIAHGARVTEVFHAVAPGAQFKPGCGAGRAAGAAPDHASYRSFATFDDPDGNQWLLQEITTRLPGRGLGLDVESMAELLRETEKHHGQYEPTAPKHHWSDWYAAYIVARHRGRASEDAAEDAALHMESVLVGAVGRSQIP